MIPDTYRIKKTQ